jgi:hypothetical protein
MLAICTPPFLCIQILEYIYKKAYHFFLGRSRHHRRRYNLPDSHTPYAIASYAKLHGTAKPRWLTFGVSLPPLFNTATGSSPNAANIPTSFTVSSHQRHLRNLLQTTRIFHPAIPVTSNLGPCGNLAALTLTNASPT